MEDLTRTIAILVEVIILTALLGAILYGVWLSVINLGLSVKLKKIVTVALVTVCIPIITFFTSHLISFYPSITSRGYLEQSNTVFWAGQIVYLENIFLPIIIGILILIPVFILIFIFGFLRRYRLWKLGKPENRSGQWYTRLTTTISIALTNLHTYRQKDLYPSTMHILVFGGSAILISGKIIRLFSYVVGINNPPQAVFLSASWVSEIGGVLVIIGGLLAIYRRYLLRPTYLDTKPDDTLIFILALLIIITGFMIKGYRIATSDAILVGWPIWSPVSYIFSFAFPTFITEASNELFVWHRALIHTIPAAIFLGYIWIGDSRLRHMILVPLNVFFRTFKPKGALTPIDLKSKDIFGAGKIEDFSWKHLMDLDACVRCGRCQDVCPAFSSGKILNPKNIIQNLKIHLDTVYPLPFKRKPINSRSDMINKIVTDEAIWDCTTCRACQQVCPAYIEHVDKVIDMRRNTVMEKGKFPGPAQDALKSLRKRGHPFRGITATRTEWYDGLGIKVLGENNSVDILFWVGCTSALRVRNMKVSQAIVKILQALGINFGVLGADENCCGDPARRIGDEYLFQTMCHNNIEIFKKYNVKKILTACPHCYNSLKYEYAQFGGNYEVIHHTQYFADLIRDNQLKLSRQIEQKLTYHDSCYLGRYNDIYQEPRQILHSISSNQLKELSHCGNNSFCCGGGGGHLWMEEEPSKRVSDRRVMEVIKAKVDLLAVSCPYCMSMFEDGLKARGVDERIKTVDLSELIAQSLIKNK